MKIQFVSLIISVISFKCNCHDIKGFDDTVLFNINWPGDKTENLDLTGSDYIVVTSSHKEKYKCILPNIQEKEVDDVTEYDGFTPLEILFPLFRLPSCSYRLESYWTYEICHGRYIRQYHEDREGKKVKLQEYILGKWDDGFYNILLQEIKSESSKKDAPIPHKKIEGINLPYFEVAMGNGSICDLNQKPRETRVLYFCYAHGKHEIFSLKETSTCQYEIIVLSPLLCAHPNYRPQETGENQINCIPLQGSPNKPYNLVKMKLENLKYRKRSDIEQIRVEFMPLNLNEKEHLSKPESPIDTSPVESFLSGKYCLNGGSGWWKYEFCYGKSVEQYHVEKDGRKTSINLGRFDKKKHLDWLQKNPHKRPKPSHQRTQLSHLYSGGSICDKTGKPRQTEVKLKCLENAASVNAVSLYLLEPRFCEYILGVESPLICDILARADENGLVASNNDDVSSDDFLE